MLVWLKPTRLEVERMECPCGKTKGFRAALHDRSVYSNPGFLWDDYVKPELVNELFFAEPFITVLISTGFMFDYQLFFSCHF